MLQRSFCYAWKAGEAPKVLVQNREVRTGLEDVEVVDEHVNAQCSIGNGVGKCMV